MTRNKRIAATIAEWRRADTEESKSTVLYEYLGWTWSEYAQWMRTGEPPVERKGSA